MKSFEDLDQKELYRSAIEDFAVDVNPEDNAETIRAALLETGITWADYVAQHPEVAPEPVAAPEVKVDVTVNREQEQDRGNVVTSADVKGAPAPAPVVRVAESPIQHINDQYLIKMVRDNVRFDVRGYSFTQEHPYALVSAEDAQYILSKEEGFRQALPNELAEFYS